MITVKIVYNTFLEDVKKFHDLLIFFDSIDLQKAPINATDRSNKAIQLSPGVETQQILRANFYLVLYNLVEATEHIIVQNLKDAIKDEEIHISKLRSNIHKLYFQGLFKDVTSTEKIVRLCTSIMEQSSSKTKKIQIDKIFFENTSGNLTYSNFKNIVTQIGCAGRLTVIEKDLDVAMERTVKLRNKLAHGNESFSTVGAGITIQEIDNNYNLITTYLTSVIDNFETYLQNKKFMTL